MNCASLLDTRLPVGPGMGVAGSISVLDKGGRTTASAVRR